MSDYIKEKRLELDDLWEEFDCGEITSEQLFDKTFKLFQSSLQEMEERTREEERERIGKAMEPAFNDFSAAAQRMITTGFLKPDGVYFKEEVLQIIDEV